MRKVHNLNGMANGYTWTPPNEVHDFATAEELRLILEEAKERIRVQTDDAEKLYQRSLILISFTITTLITIIGYIGIHLSWDRKNILLGIIAICLLIVSSILKNNLIPTKYRGVGVSPELYLDKDFYTVGLNERQTTQWWFLYDMNRAYNDRIKQNATNNDRRSERIKKAITWLYYIPFFVVIAVIICASVGIK